MENLSDKSRLNTIETAVSQISEQSIDTQINLPDYCSDIRKILKCFVVPNIFACNISGDRITADGEALIRVLYIGESDKMECYEQSVPFSRYAELSNPDGGLCAYASAETEYVNCRAVSQRRISVCASIAVNFKVNKITAENIFCGSDDGSIEVKSEKLMCTVPIGVCNKIFEMSETVALPQSLPTAAAVINTHTCASPDSVKTIADKMLIKGDMITDILYCSDGESSQIEKYRHSMPISQIVDIEGIDENSICNVNIDIISVCVSPKSDSEGKNRLFDISVKAQANISAYENKEIYVTSDGYSTEYEIESEYKNIFLKNLLFTYKENKQITENFDLSSLSAKEITEVFALKCTGSTKEEEGNIIGKGEVPIGILYKNEQGEYGYTEKTVEFSFECHAGEKVSKLSAKPHFTVTEAVGNISPSQGAEIRVSVDISMPVFEEYEKSVCTKLEIIEDKKKEPCDFPLTVYFSQSGEKIWDIAKKYNTTCERIKEDNELTEDEVSDNTMLLISAV